jgi:hypothetical protein
MTTDLAAALNPTETMNNNPLIAMLHKMRSLWSHAQMLRSRTMSKLGVIFIKENAESARCKPLIKQDIYSR